MANNLFISYDLHAPGKNYGAITAAIQGLSSRWAKIHYSLWYVKTDLSYSEVARKIRAVMDADDSLIVIDSSTNQATWFNLKKEVSDYVLAEWTR